MTERSAEDTALLDVGVSMTGNSVAIRDDAPLTMVEVAAQMTLLQEALGTVMIAGVHYGQLEDDNGNARLKKPILYKAGAEKLLQLFKLRAHYDEIGSVHQQTFIAYRHRAVLVHYPSGLEVGEGLGSCNSRERKYRHAKDPWDLDNTLLKMSCKRALAAAVLSATAASDIFDQAEGPVTTPQHRKLNAMLGELEERHPMADGTWEDWSRNRAREIAGVESRADLNAEEMSELIEETSGLLEDLDRKAGGAGEPPHDPPPAPPADIDASSPAAILVDFGKYNGETLGEILQHDRDYVEWLARDGRNETVRGAAQELIA